jgi:hypothetical protein
MNPQAARATRHLPADPASFIAEAERITNAWDHVAATALYVDDISLELITDGAIESYQGREEARRAWQGLMSALRKRTFTLDKTLLVAADGVIVNTWHGSLAGRTDARGLELWVFDADGLVRQHRMVSFLNVKPSNHPVARLRLALVAPIAALTILREQRRATRIRQRSRGQK